MRCRIAERETMLLALSTLVVVTDLISWTLFSSSSGSHVVMGISRLFFVRERIKLSARE